MRVLGIVKNDLKVFFGDWKAAALLIGLPFVFICLFLAALSPFLNHNRFVEQFGAAIVDKENSVESRMLISQFVNSEATAKLMKVSVMDEASAMKELDENKLAAVVIIPEGFTYSVSIGENKPFIVIGNKSKPLLSAQVRNYMQGAANLVSAAQSGVMTAFRYYEKIRSSDEFYDKKYADSIVYFSLKAMGRYNVFSERQISDIPDVTPAEYFTACLLAVFLMFAGLPGMKSLVNEKSLGITGRLTVSPVRGWQIITAKFITAFLLGIAQLLLIIILTSVIFKAYWGGPVWQILLMFAAVIFSSAAWAVFVAAIAPTPASADIIGNLGILIMAVVGGSIYPLTSMPDIVKRLSDFTVNKWAVQGFLVVFSGDRALSVLPFAGTLLMIGCIFILLSIPLFKLARS